MIERSQHTCSLKDDGYKRPESILAVIYTRSSGRVLMFAFMNRQSLQETVNSGSAVYWSRSRKRLWRKGEESGHAQRVRSIRTDCDGDVLLLAIDQTGGIACHPGRESCFFYQLQGEMWAAVDPVLKDPREIYGK